VATLKTAKWQPWKRLSGYPDGTEIIFWVSPDALHRDKEFGTPYDTPAWSTWTEIVDFGHLSPFWGHGNPENDQVATLAVPKFFWVSPDGLQYVLEHS